MQNDLKKEITRLRRVIAEKRRIGESYDSEAYRLAALLHAELLVQSLPGPHIRFLGH